MSQAQITVQYDKGFDRKYYRCIPVNFKYGLRVVEW